MKEFFLQLSPLAQLWVSLGLAALISLLIGLLARSLLLRSLRLYLRNHPRFLPATAPGHLYRPLGLFLPLLAFHLSLPFTALEAQTSPGAETFLTVQVLGLLSLGWLLIRLLDIAQDYVQGRFDLEDSDNLSARKVRTQTQFLKRLGSVVIFILIGAAVLTRFEVARELGNTLLASAGVASIIIGFAAQKFIANLLAGFQIAFTQPVRIDDVVIVEGEWGRIEEITLTYVVVRIWDKRRLVLPITYFVEKPFQNWTRTSADIVGSVFLYTDFHVPVEALRQELRRLLESNPLWDGEVCVLQ
ncbi:MAG: mechanosensitive ion channel family protein, partial [Bacteroidetes bacterium]